MTLFKIDLEWDVITLMQLTVKAMIENGFKKWDNTELQPEFAMKDNGNDAFVIHGYKNNKGLRIIIQNQEHQIVISTGNRTKLDVTNIKTKYFKNTELNKASNYFEKILEKL